MAFVGRSRLPIILSRTLRIHDFFHPLCLCVILTFSGRGLSPVGHVSPPFHPSNEVQAPVHVPPLIG
jgi:hypothetical protein